MVDIGWHGSLQTALGNLLKTEPCAPTHLDGYYLGLFREAAATAERPGIPGERLGFLLQNGTPDGRQSELQRFVEILEIFFASPEPTLLHFRCDENGSTRPIFAPGEHSLAQSRAIRAIRAGILLIRRDPPCTGIRPGSLCRCSPFGPFAHAGGSLRFRSFSPAACVLEKVPRLGPSPQPDTPQQTFFFGPVL